jgi:hypothetical protein
MWRKTYDTNNLEPRAKKRLLTVSSSTPKTLFEKSIVFRQERSPPRGHRNTLDLLWPNAGNLQYGLDRSPWKTHDHLAADQSLFVHRRRDAPVHHERGSAGKVVSDAKDYHMFSLLKSVAIS